MPCPDLPSAFPCWRGPSRKPGPGRISLAGKGLKTDRREPNRAGSFKLSLRPKGSLKRKLTDRGRARIKVKVAYRPDYGTRNDRRKRLKLIRSR